MAKKKILVKDMLELIPADKEVMIQFFAYGLHYAWSTDCGKTVQDMKDNMNYDCLNAQVGTITAKNDYILMCAEIVH